jgi:hypothetical protein
MGSGSRRASMLSAGCAAALWTAAACTFPDFHVAPASAGATNGGASTGASGSSTGGGAAANGAGAKADGGTGTTGGTTPNAGSGGDDGPPVPVDIGPCGQREHATHCWNGKLDDDETDVDCGGARCSTCAADQLCTAPRDCGSGLCTTGKCERLFTIQYLQEVPDEETTSFRFKAKLAYLGKAPVLLSDITVRYYFSRNNVVEPLLPGGSVIQFPQMGDISGSALWSIGRQLRGNGITGDAYLEVGFTKGKIITEGESLELDASVNTGDGKSLFNQKTHYSFDPGTTLHESQKLTAYVKGRRVWGKEPAIDDPPSCFHLGVNLDGPAETVGDDAWLTSPASVLARYINALVVLKPATDKGREDMLRAGFFFHNDSFSYPVENGSYALLAYAWSADGAETGTLKVQDTERDAFHAISFAGGGPWVALGPYRVTVANGQLKLGAKGDLRIGGIELRLLDE